MKAVICIGISASGKSSWAEEYVFQKPDWKILCRDNVRHSILEKQLGHFLSPGELWKKWKWKNEDQVTKEIDVQLADCVVKQQNIIIADTNLNKGRREVLQQKLESLGYEVKIKRFDISFDEALKRDTQRADSVGFHVLWKQYMQWNDEFGTKYVPNKALLEAVVCDIDGTIAHMHNRGPFDWDKVDQDTLDNVVMTMVSTFVYEKGYHLIMLSGRDSICREKTEKWLADNGVPYTSLFMRAENDCRKDSIVKEELFWEHVANDYNVVAVFDDRPQMVKLWLQLGLKTISVSDPYLDF